MTARFAFVDAGAEALLDGSWSTATASSVRLHRNDVADGLSETEIGALTEAAFTEATFPGYAAVAASGWVITGSPVTATAAVAVFQSTADAAAQSIFGFYVTRDSDGVLIGFGDLGASGPFTVEFANDRVTVTPTVRLRNSPAPLGGGHLDAGTVVTAESITASQTSILLDTSGDAAPWTTASDDYPLYVTVGSELVAVAGVSGSSPDVTLTGCTRSVNGVDQAHDAGTVVAGASPWDVT